MLSWNAAALIQAALNAKTAGRPITLPIDRLTATGRQLQEVTPNRYDGPLAGQNFGWIVSVATYLPPGRITTPGDEPLSWDLFTEPGPLITVPATPEIVSERAVHIGSIGGLLGIMPEQVDANISAGKTNWWNAASYAINSVAYDGLNFFSGGNLERFGQRAALVNAGALGVGSLIESTLIDATAFAGGLAVDGVVGQYLVSHRAV